MNIYFGFSPAYFSSHPGSYNAPQEFLDGSKEFIAADIECDIGGEKKLLVVPDIPAKKLTLSDLRSCSFFSADKVPDFLKNSLIKCEQPTKGGIQGFHSGRRSAIVTDGKSWYRLKGCGDLTNGITTRSVEWDDSGGSVEIRGVQFENTTVRELYMTYLVNQALAQSRLLPANESIGYWKYETHWPVPCTCALFKTYGDRRLNDHVLFGLESLLPCLIEENDLAPILEKFHPERKPGNEVTPTWVPLLDDINAPTLLDLRTIPLTEHEPDSPLLLPEILVSAEYKTLLSFFGEQGPNSPSLLSMTYWELGWEAGRILRAIHGAKISWGTYFDKLGMHCNAHPNNFVLLPPPTTDEQKTCFLAPLDFDMAFTEDSITSLSFVETFQDLLDTEVRSMRLAHAGDSELNSGARGTAIIPEKYEALKWALRDTLVKAFNLGYSGGSTDSTPNYQAMHALIAFALVVSRDVIA